MFHLTPAALAFFGNSNNVWSVDVYELVGKNVKPGCPKPMGRMSFSKLPLLNELVKNMACYI